MEPVEVLVVAADLSAGGDEILARAIEAAGGEVNLLVNCAGRCLSPRIFECTLL